MSRSLSARIPVVRRRAASRRYFAGALAVFALIGQLATMAHLVVVQHALCLQHGELVHSGEHASWHPTARQDNATTALCASDVSSEHGHDHCGVVAHRREALFIEPASQAVPLTAAPALARSAALEARSSGQGIFRFAPKGSPPA